MRDLYAAAYMLLSLIVLTKIYNLNAALRNVYPNIFKPDTMYNLNIASYIIYVQIFLVLTVGTNTITKIENLTFERPEGSLNLYFWSTV